MLDPALCARPTDQWLTLKSMLSAWLATPILIVLPLVALTLVPWMIPKSRWRRQLSGTGTVLLLTYFIATLPLTIAVANKGLVAFLPADRGVTADAIVVLGRGDQLRNSRVEIAAELWKDHRAPLIFVSGVGDAPPIVQQLQAQGIPQQALSDEGCSRTTEENALFTAKVLQTEGVKRIILVTDPPHMLRSLLTFRSVGFEVIPHTSPLPPDIGTEEKAAIVFYEYMGLVSYGLRGHFLPQSLPEAKHPQVAIRENGATALPLRGVMSYEF